MSEILKKIKDSKKLGEICDFISPGLQEFEGIKNYVATADVVFNEIKNSSKVTYQERPSRANVEAQKGDILVAKMAETKKFLIVNDKFEDDHIFSTGFVNLRVKNGLLPKYLFYFLNSKSFNQQKNKFAVGATQKAINNAALKRIELPFPVLEIQKKIVDRMDAIQRTQKMNNNLIQKTDELFQSLLRKELNYKDNWTVEPLGKLAQIKGGGTPSREKQKYFQGEIPWVTVKDLQEGRLEIYETQEHISDEALANSAANLIKKNTILVVTRVGLGKVVIARTRLSFNQDIKGVIADEKVILPNFLFYVLFLYGPEIERHGIGATVKGVTLPYLKSLKISLPPLETQKQIVEKINAVQDYKKSLIKQKIKLQELFDSVLYKSMKGELDK